jgi:hypothetical protein
MSRYRLHALVVALLVVAVENAVAQPPRNPPPKGMGAPASSGKFIMIPGLVALSMESVHREIGLTADQKQQLKAVSDGFAASSHRLDDTFSELSQEDQQKQRREFSNRSAQAARAAQHKAESILSPQQLKTVQKLSFEFSATRALANPDIQEKLGLTPDQRRRLSSVYDKSGERIQQIERETAAQVMQLLDNDQANELKKMVEPQPKPR